MAGCHGFARRACDILIFLAHHWKVDVVLAEEGYQSNVVLDPQTLGRTWSTSTNLFAPNVESEDIINELRPVEDMNKNPLFWPFPLQARPLLGISESLEKAGFQLHRPKGGSGSVVTAE
jgi:hypothetical protein